jgi:hypothetical protein
MSQILKGILGTLAVSLTLGAVQFASGHDLAGGKAIATAPESAAAPVSITNRIAKADREALPAVRIRTRTVALRLDSLADTSVLIRVPVVAEETRARPLPSMLRPGRAAVACEPVVSVLTDVAKQLQPGRCVT